MMDQPLGLLFRRQESAVRALIDIDKPVEAPFDPAMLAGAAGRANDQVAVRQAADTGNGLALVEHHIDAPATQAEPPCTIACIGQGQAQRHLGGFLGGDLKYPQAPLATFENYLGHAVPGQLQPGEKLGPSGYAEHDSAGRRDHRQVGRRIVSCGREIPSFPGLMSGTQTDPNHQRESGMGRQRSYPLLDLDGRSKRLNAIGKESHQLAALVIHQTSAMRFNGAPNTFGTAFDHIRSLGTAEAAYPVRSACDIHTENGQ